MGRQFLHIEYLESMLCEKRHDGRQGKVGKMFVVNGVELIVLDQTQEMRKLKGGDAIRFEQNPESTHEVVDVRHVRQHVVGDDQISLPALGGESGGKFIPENASRISSPLSRAAAAVLAVGSTP